MITQGICNIRDVIMFVSLVAVFANTRPQENVSRENYKPCLQLLSHDQSLYYGQIGSRVVEL